MNLNEAIDLLKKNKYLKLTGGAINGNLSVNTLTINTAIVPDVAGGKSAGIVVAGNATPAGAAILFPEDIFVRQVQNLTQPVHSSGIVISEGSFHIGFIVEAFKPGRGILRMSVAEETV